MPTLYYSQVYCKSTHAFWAEAKRFWRERHLVLASLRKKLGIQLLTPLWASTTAVATGNDHRGRKFFNPERSTVIFLKKESLKSAIFSSVSKNGIFSILGILTVGSCNRLLEEHV
jgi:hypothetical protein